MLVSGFVPGEGCPELPDAAQGFTKQGTSPCQVDSAVMYTQGHNCCRWTVAQIGSTLTVTWPPPPSSTSACPTPGYQSTCPLALPFPEKSYHQNIWLSGHLDHVYFGFKAQLKASLCSLGQGRSLANWVIGEESAGLSLAIMELDSFTVTGRQVQQLSHSQLPH